MVIYILRLCITAIINKSIYYIYYQACLKTLLFMMVFICIVQDLKNNSYISQSDIKKLINKDFIIEPKHDLKNLIKYINYYIDNKNKSLKLLVNDEYDKFIDLHLTRLYNFINLKKLNKDIIIFLYKKIFDHLKRGFINNKIVKINSSIKSIEGEYISKIIKAFNFKNCLEIGFAFGISAFYILSNPNTKLISIDPNQKSQWNNMGLQLIKEFDFDNRHKLIEKKSYKVLPDLLIKNKNSFDFIFIDGWHTFDYTLIDFFYSNLLLKNNGIIIIDDALHNGVKKCIKYIETNYKFYKKLESPNTVACFQKISEDNRDWDFNVDF